VNYQIRAKYVLPGLFYIAQVNQICCVNKLVDLEGGQSELSVVQSTSVLEDLRAVNGIYIDKGLFVFTVVASNEY
jgi:capsular polysaccharide biosynthesis protein